MKIISFKKEIVVNILFMFETSIKNIDDNLKKMESETDLGMTDRLRLINETNNEIIKAEKHILKLEKKINTIFNPTEPKKEKKKLTKELTKELTWNQIEEIHQNITETMEEVAQSEDIEEQLDTYVELEKDIEKCLNFYKKSMSISYV